MRAIPTLPRKKFARHTDAVLPGIAHWGMDDSATTTVADFYTFSNLTASSTSTVTAPIYIHDGSAIGLGRDTGAVTVGGASTAGQRTLLAGDWFYEALVVIDTLTTDNQTLIAHRGTGGTSTSNALIQIQTRTDGRLRFNAQSGTLTDQDAHSIAGAITAGTALRHIAVRKRTLNGTVWISFFVDGKHVGTDIVTASSGGSAGQWYLGANDGVPALRFDGKIYETRIAAAALSEAFGREHAARALRPYDLADLIANQTQAVYGRVLVENPEDGPGDGTDTFMLDLDNIHGDGANPSWRGRPMGFVDSLEASENIDSPGSGSFECAREIFDWSLSPFMSDESPVSSSHGQSLLRLAQRVRFETAIVPMGTDFDDVPTWAWITTFDGFISKIAFADGGSNRMKIACRDLWAPVQWTFCRPLASNAFQEMVYGDDVSGVPIEDVIQAIIDDHVPATGIRGGTPVVDVPVVPSWNLRERSIGFEPLADVITNKAEQIGFVLRYKWNDVRKEFRLTFYEPDRTSPPTDHTFATEAYETITQAEINEENIRNVAEVVYSDRTGTPDNLGAFPRERFLSSDSTSITQYGERYCQVAEEATSQIDTATEAERLADAIISDLARPVADVILESRFAFFAELNDYDAIEADDRHFQADTEFAITSITHRIDPDEAGGRTTLGLRGLPCGGVDRHIGTIANPGIAPFAPFLPVPVPGAITVDSGERLGNIAWEFPSSPLARAFDQAEIHMTTSSGAWTPDDTTLVKTTRGNKATIPDLDPTKTYQTKVIFKDRNNNRTSALAASDFVPKPHTQELGTWQTRRERTIQQVDIGTTLGVFGTAAATETTPVAKTATVAGPGNNTGSTVNYGTGTVTDADAGVLMASYTDRVSLPMFSTMVMVSSLTNIRIACGCFAGGTLASATGADDPGGAGFGFLFNGADAKWQTYVNDGVAASALTPVGSNVDVITQYRLSCGFMADTGTIVFYINDVLVNAVSTDVTMVGAIYPLCGVRTLTTVNKILRFSRLSLTSL